MGRFFLLCAALLSLAPHVLGAGSEVSGISVAAPRVTEVPEIEIPEQYSRVLNRTLELVEPTVGYSISIGPNSFVEARCWYPVASVYVTLPRVLFYATMVFAVLARTQPWLVIGSLAAGLVYSGIAAIHACIVIWSHHVDGNIDIFPTIGIMIFSVALFVPLLNWSKTIRELGVAREEDAFGRTIIILWAIIIAIGAISVSVADLLPNQVGGDYAFAPVPPKAMHMTCVPPEGSLNLAAGQGSDWDRILVTEEFIEENGCEDPCKSGATWSLTKNPEELRPLTERQVIRLYSENISQLNSGSLTFAAYFQYLGVIAMAWVLLQALVAIFFGRREPMQVRNVIYLRLVSLFTAKSRGEISRTGKPSLLADIPARVIAYTYYLWVVTTSILSPMLAVAAIVATEIFLQELPAGADYYQVEAWSPWVGAALVIAVAVIAKFHDIFQDMLIRLLNKSFSGINRCFHGRQAQHHSSDAGSASTSDKTSGSAKNALKGAFRKVVKGCREIWFDHKMFWTNTWEYANDDSGKFHLAQRLLIPAELQKVPDGWVEMCDEKDGLTSRDNSWQPLGSFVDKCTWLDDEQKQRNNGEGYLWQPRVVRVEQVRPRATFDWEQFRGIFHFSKRQKQEFKNSRSAKSQQRRELARKSRHGVNAGPSQTHYKSTLSPSGSSSSGDTRA